MAKKKKIETTLRPSLEKAGLELITLSQQKSQLEEEIKERKRIIREKLEELGFDGYKGKDVKISIILRSRYEVSLEKAIELVPLEDLREARLLSVDRKGFKDYLARFEIKADPASYEISKGQSIDVRASPMPKKDIPVAKDY